MSQLHDVAVKLPVRLEAESGNMGDLERIILAIQTAQELGKTVIATYYEGDDDEPEHIWFGAVDSED